MHDLNTIEKNIIEVLGTDILTLEKLATKVGYEVGGQFRRAVASLSKRGILGNKRPGYFVQEQYLDIVEELSDYR